LSSGAYRIKTPTVALFEENGAHVARMVPAGSVINVDGAAFDGEKLVNVTWEGKSVMMFAQDLRARAEPASFNTGA
jgi:hypothetical protein